MAASATGATTKAATKRVAASISLTHVALDQVIARCIRSIAGSSNLLQSPPPTSEAPEAGRISDRGRLVRRPVTAGAVNQRSIPDSRQTSSGASVENCAGQFVAENRAGHRIAHSGHGESGGLFRRGQALIAARRQTIAFRG